MNSGCPRCRGVDSYSCSLCKGRTQRTHRKGDPVSFVDHGARTWTGEIVAVRSRIKVRWPDGVIGSFAHRHAHRLTIIGATV